MKTTLEIPDDLFRATKVEAARRGHTLRALVTEALRNRLASPGPYPADSRPRGMPALPRVPKSELRRLHRLIESEFGRVNEADWR